LSSDDDDDDDNDDAHLPEHDALADQDVSTTDGAGGAGTTLDEAPIPGPARAGVPSTIRPPAIDRVPSIPPLGARLKMHVPCHEGVRSRPSSRSCDVSG
jgi:hypothetical protein